MTFLTFASISSKTGSIWMKLSRGKGSENNDRIVLVVLTCGAEKGFVSGISCIVLITFASFWSFPSHRLSSKLAWTRESFSFSVLCWTVFELSTLKQLSVDIFDVYQIPTVSAPQNSKLSTFCSCSNLPFSIVRARGGEWTSWDVVWVSPLKRLSAWIIYSLFRQASRGCFVLCEIGSV